MDLYKMRIWHYDSVLTEKTALAYHRIVVFVTYEDFYATPCTLWLLYINGLGKDMCANSWMLSWHRYMVFILNNTWYYLLAVDYRLCNMSRPVYSRIIVYVVYSQPKWYSLLIDLGSAALIVHSSENELCISGSSMHRLALCVPLSMKEWIRAAVVIRDFL